MEPDGGGDPCILRVSPGDNVVINAPEGETLPFLGRIRYFLRANSGVNEGEFLFGVFWYWRPQDIEIPHAMEANELAISPFNDDPAVATISGRTSVEFCPG